MQAHTPPRDGGMNNGNQEAAKVGGMIATNALDEIERAALSSPAWQRWHFYAKHAASAARGYMRIARSFDRFPHYKENAEYCRQMATNRILSMRRRKKVYARLARWQARAALEKAGAQP